MVDVNRWWNGSSMAKQWAFVIDLDFVPIAISISQS
jgi:hypothetical protein